MRLPARTARGRDSFFVSPSNRIALAMIDGWRGWPQGKLVLSGPPGSGKTHLAHVWAALSAARIVSASSLTGANVPALAEAPLVVEDVPAIAGDRPAEEALFHLHNLALANAQPLLLTGAGNAATWPIALPDLRSRLLGTTGVALEEPDDQLLEAVLVKLMADRQLVPPQNLLTYLVRRIDRSLAEATRVVAELDAASLGRRQPVTRALAIAVLDKGQTEA
jgi:chromosomal replication initiation ATPase DnaA